MQDCKLWLLQEVLKKPLIERLLTDFEGFIVREKIVSAYDVTRGKPAPDPYLKGLLKAGGLQPHEAYGCRKCALRS